jgi:hypothetical protein
MVTIKYSDTWLCSNGEKMLIEEMSSEHIQNCIKKIQRDNFRKEWLEILEYELELRRELDDLRFRLNTIGRNKVLRRDSIDKNDLFNKPLSQSIQFLQGLLDKNGDVILKEVWYGYEDNDVVLEYESDESDDEFRTRISMMLHFGRKELERKYDERCVLEDKKRSLQQEMDDLDSQIKNTF